MPVSPGSLREWRELELVEPARAAWKQFEAFFQQHGYKLFEPDLDDPYNDTLKPPVDCPRIRSEDTYSRFLPECLGMEINRSVFFPQTGCHVAARSPTNTDVVIRIMAIGDEGREHLAIMRALTAPDAQVPENRTVPMIAELECDDVVFGVFPYVYSLAMERPWFESLGEFLDALEQVMEGFTFLHERLIAHRDFAYNEVFSNYGRGWQADKARRRCDFRPPIFRSCCPGLRYMINDFELSVQFKPDSDPSTRLVTGIPIARYGYGAQDYHKSLPPETLLEAPYCPFKADMYQLGMDAMMVLPPVRSLPDLWTLFTALASDDPESRPAAAQALATLREIRRALPEDVLDGIPVNSVGKFAPRSPGDACPCRLCTPREILGPVDLNQIALQ